MAKNINLANLIKKGLAEEWQVTRKGIGPNPLFPGDRTTPKEFSAEEIASQKAIFFDPQTYQELELQEDDIVVFASGGQEWRIVETGVFDNRILVSFALV